jgi:hypothetical protein
MNFNIKLSSLLSLLIIISAKMLMKLAKNQFYTYFAMLGLSTLKD